MNTKNTENQQRFDMRMNSQERISLEKLAEKNGVTMSEWIKDIIRQRAKRAKLWT